MFIFQIVSCLTCTAYLFASFGIFSTLYMKRLNGISPRASYQDCSMLKD